MKWRKREFRRREAVDIVVKEESLGEERETVDIAVNIVIL